MAQHADFHPLNGRTEGVTDPAGKGSFSGGSGAGLIDYLSFAGSTQNDGAIFRGRLPLAYAGGSLITRVAWRPASGTSALDVVFQATWASWTPSADNLTAQSLGTAVAGSAVTRPSTLGQFVVSSITNTSGAQIDSLSAGEWFELLIRRLQDDSGDTMTAVDAWVLGVSVDE